MTRPLVSFEAGQFKSKSAERTLIAAHCYGMALAVGLDTVYLNVDPPDQSEVMEWNIYELIVGEDVGPENAGRPPSRVIQPTPPSDVVWMHVQWAPGAYEGGVPSQQQALTDRYRPLSAPQKLVVLLTALKVFLPKRGVRRVRYPQTDLGGGIVG